MTKLYHPVLVQTALQATFSTATLLYTSLTKAKATLASHINCILKIPQITHITDGGNSNPYFWCPYFDCINDGQFSQYCCEQVRCPPAAGAPIWRSWWIDTGSCGDVSKGKFPCQVNLVLDLVLRHLHSAMFVVELIDVLCHFLVS